MIAARIIAIAGSALATSASAQVPVGSPADVLAAVEACRAATGPAGVDEAKLIEAGWAAGTASKGGKPIPMPLKILGKDGVKAIVIVPPEPTLCVVTARIAKVSAFGATAQAFDTALATTRKAKPNEPTTAYWFPQGHLIQLEMTGKPEAPGVRVAVMHRSQEKK